MINFKSKTTKKLISAALIVIAIQAVVLIIFRRAEPVSIKQAIEDQVEQKQELDSVRKSQLKIQLAISDFRGKHGSYPTSLQELVPEYFDVVPIHPKTRTDFAYTVEGDNFFIGTEEEILLAKSGKTTKKDSQQVAGTTAADGTDSEQQALIASLAEAPEEFIYDPAGKRDPFRPFNFAPQIDDKALTPLQRYSIGQLKLTVILDGFDEPFAMVENSVGKGFKISRGTKIGENGGEVVEILKDRIVILERSVDFTGRETTKTIEMRLRTKDQEDAQIVR
ncbi:MAG: pilus assembly protein PilP [Bdellovibrionota bacterium]